MFRPINEKGEIENVEIEIENIARIDKKDNRKEKVIDVPAPFVVAKKNAKDFVAIPLQVCEQIIGERKEENPIRHNAYNRPIDCRIDALKSKKFHLLPLFEILHNAVRNIMRLF